MAYPSLKSINKVVIVLAIRGAPIKGFSCPSDDETHKARQLARGLSQMAGFKVIFGFYEYGLPSLEDALEQAFAEGANEITIVDPEMARNGRYTEKDEPKVCQQGEVQSHSVQIVFQGTEEISQVARYLADVVKKRNHYPTDI